MIIAEKESDGLMNHQEKNSKNIESRCHSTDKITEKNHEDEEGSKVLQYVAATAANLSIISAGSVFGWSSSALVDLEKYPVSSNNPIGLPITKDESSWIGSLMLIGAVSGSLVAGWMSEKFGRKRSLLFSAIPYIVGWVLIGTSSSVIQFYIARFIFGVGIAIDCTIVPMYCGEIAESSIRGMLGSFLQLFATVGLLFAFAVGPYVSYTVFWISCGVLPVVFFICFLFMPESPYYLLSQGKKSEAQASLAKFRGKSKTAVLSELNEIQVVIEQANRGKISDLVTVRANFKALLLSCAVLCFQQMTGIAAVLFYAQNIFQSSGSTLDPAICTIIIGIVQICASGLTSIIADSFGRRTLLITSGIGAAISSGTLGYYFFLKEVEKSPNISSLGWLPITSLVLFMSLYCLGWGPLPWAIMGEMFSSEVKSKASSVTVLIYWSLSFTITKFFSNVVTAWGTYTAFWMFTSGCIMSIVFVITLLPETKGKSLHQIQDELNGVKISGDKENHE